MELRWWWLRYVAMQTMREAGGTQRRIAAEVRRLRTAVRAH